MKSFEISEIEEIIIISLYADDTNLILSKDDNINYIYNILNKWC